MAGRSTKTRNVTQERPCQQTASALSTEESPPAVSGSLSPVASIEVSTLKLEIVNAVRTEIADIIKLELQKALAETLSTIIPDLQTLRSEWALDKAAANAKFVSLKETVLDMEHSLMNCSDDVVSMKATIQSLTATVARLENKCEDFEARSRRNNIRILGVPEGSDSATITEIAALLREAFGLDKEPVLNRSHRVSLSKPKDASRPRPLVVRFHYYTDCAYILRRAKEQRQLKVRGWAISIFPDFTAGVARARAAFNEVRQFLRSVEGVRYRLFYPARLRISYNGVDKDFLSAQDAKIYAEKLTKS
uniref:L1 transposable element RRM domain-containing protein n=1 Tax=Paramormyrops kingsleyae TaxID=1676925 RepID=A0A3B3T8J5_9TELE